MVIDLEARFRRPMNHKVFPSKKDRYEAGLKKFKRESLGWFRRSGEFSEDQIGDVLNKLGIIDHLAEVPEFMSLLVSNGVITYNGSLESLSFQSTTESGITRYRINYRCDGFYLLS